MLSSAIKSSYTQFFANLGIYLKIQIETYIVNVVRLKLLL